MGDTGAERLGDEMGVSVKGFWSHCWRPPSKADRHALFTENYEKRLSPPEAVKTKLLQTVSNSGTAWGRRPVHLLRYDLLSVL